MNEFERPPLRNTDAEQATLGGMMLHVSAIEEVTEVIEARDFYEPRHEQIFTAILDLYGRGTPADALTVARELERRKDLAKVGGPAYLHTLMESVPTAANASWYAEMVHEKGVLRRLVEAATRVVQMAYATDGADLEEIVNRAHSEIFGVSASLAEVEESSNAASAERFGDGLEKAKVPGVMTGFSDLDALTGGFKPGQLIVIGARPSVGKTTLGVDILRHVSIKEGGHSAMFSLEMIHDELTGRMFSAEGRIPLHHLRPDRMDDGDWARFSQRYGDIANAAIHIDDSADLDFVKVVTRARKLHRRYGLRVILVDYLQMLSYGGRRFESREREVAAMIYGLKALGKELGIPVIALVQLNRGSAQRADKKPVMSDARESGTIEQAADIFVLIHREDMENREHPRAGEADLIVDKHRGGPKATITVAFQGHYSRFVDMAWTPHGTATA